MPEPDEPLTRLVRREPIRHPGDVARLRLALRRAGYEADAAAIQWAYGEWSEDHYAAGWMTLPAAADGADARLVAALLEYLTPAGG